MPKTHTTASYEAEGSSSAPRRPRETPHWSVPALEPWPGRGPATARRGQDRPPCAGFIVRPRDCSRGGRACEHMFVSTEATILHADLDAFYASVEQRDDPRLRGRPVIVGGGRGARRQLRGQGAAACARAMGGRQALRLCPRRDRGAAPDVGVHARPAGRCSRSSGDTTPLVEGISIDEAFLDVGGLRRIVRHADRDRRAAAPRGPRAGRAADHGRRGPDEVPGQGGQRGGQAGRAAGACRPTAELAFLHPLPVERLWGVGPVTAAKLRDRGHPHGRARWPGSARPRWCRCSARAPGRHLHALAHNRDPRPVQVGRRRGSIGSQRALGRSPTHAAPRSTPSLVGAGRPGHPADARRRPGRAARWCCGCASTTSPGPPARTRSAAATAQTHDDPRRRAGAAATAPADDRASAASRWSASRSATSTSDGAVQLELPFEHGGRLRAGRRGGRGARPVRLRGGDPGRAARVATRA